MYICIEGNIGAGKTTLSIELARQLKAFYLAERFEENLLLPLFYNDPKTFAFPTEYSFLIDRHKQLVNYFENPKRKAITVGDFHFDKCLCFAKANLSAKDFVFYKKHFKAMQRSVPVPDLIVYIDTTPDLLIKNIQKRGRDIEKSLKEEYLNTLKKSFDKYYLSGQKAGTVILHLKLNEYTPAVLAQSCKKIITALKDLNLK